MPEFVSTESVYQPLWAELESGATVVTANAHAARALRYAWAHHQLARGRAAWETPRILGWDAWLEELWEEHAQRLPDGPAPLNQLETDCLWESIIKAQNGGLLDISAAAQAANLAWQRLHDFGVAYGSELWRAWKPQFQGEDAQAFLAWADLYARKLKENHWLDVPSRLADPVWPPPAAGAPAAIGYGFLQLTPAQQRIAEIRRLRMHFWPAEPRRHGRVSSADAEAEARAAAAWARRWLESDSEARIAILAPDLSLCRSSLERELMEALAPELLAQPRETRFYPYSISLGRPLKDRALGQDALALLRFRLGPCTLADASRLLRSPYCVGAAEEWNARQQLEAELRRRRWVEFSWNAWIRLLRLAESRLDAWRCPRLRQAMEQGAASPLPGAAAPGVWRKQFGAFLAAWCWPGERLNSDEHQAAEAWRELLDDFGKLDRVLGSLSAEEAFHRLERMAGARIFQPEQPHARVEVLGLLQAAGLRFDAVRVIGLSDRAWPAPARPLPFLPPLLQNRLQMPGATPQQAYEFAHAVMHRLENSAPEGIFSYPRREEDIELGPSPFLREFEPVMEPAPQPEWVFSSVWTGHDPLESYTDTGVAASGKQRGGVNLFKAQAWCPFRGFAEIRLGAEDYEVPELGWDRRDQGILAHRFLESLWLQLRDSDGLRQAIAEEKLDAILAGCRREIEAGFMEQGDDLRLALHRLELNRLCRILRNWCIEVEAQRPWFRVLAREARLEAELGGILVSMRVDRVDEFQDGRRLILDYKTGDYGSVKVWDPPRPSEPQLPLYLILATPPTAAGLAFASLRRDRWKFAGRGSGPDMPEGVKTVSTEEWAEQIGSWRGHLRALAEEFAAGLAILQPKTPQLCDQCHLHPLCRVRELHPRDHDEHDEDFDAEPNYD